MFTASQRRRVSLVTASAATAVVALAGLGGYANAAPAPVVAPTAAPTAAGPARLVPGWLPEGYVATTVDDLAAPDPAGTVTLHVERFATQAADSPRPDGVLYLEVTTGLVNGLVDTAATTQSVTLGGGAATYVDTGFVREFRWLPNPAAPDVMATVGALGNVSDSDLRGVAENVDVVGDTSGLIGDSTSGPAPDECNCPNATNMKGSGDQRNDWSTDGPNRQLSVGMTGNDAGVWQAILWADLVRYSYSGSYVTFRDCDVDGAFGLRTRSATEWWQRTDPGGSGAPNGTNADGIVGPRTWASADNRLVLSGGAVYYRGDGHTLMFRRATTAPYHYTWSWAGSGYRYTGYSGVTLDKVGC